LKSSPKNEEEEIAPEGYPATSIPPRIVPSSVRMTAFPTVSNTERKFVPLNPAQSVPGPESRHAPADGDPSQSAQPKEIPPPERDEPLPISPRNRTSTPMTKACRRAGCRKSARPVRRGGATGPAQAARCSLFYYNLTQGFECLFVHLRCASIVVQFLLLV
jgi:hypothetical protein